MTGLLTASAWAEGVPQSNPVDLATEKVLYTIGYAHLDTQWRWDIQSTIKSWIPRTLEYNFDKFEKYPRYVFNFEGSYRYMLAREYYPELYEKLKEYVAKGRWAVCGASVDAYDANVPSPESLIRQALYGNGFFKREFGKVSRDVMLADCFGFPASLPSVAAHCGLKGFITQKLSWGCPRSVPPLGVWVGPDGRGVVAAVNPGSYISSLEPGLHKEPTENMRQTARDSGLWVDCVYHGAGDQGGGPKESSIKAVNDSVAADGPVRVISDRADRIFDDLKPGHIAKLPRYEGDLLLTEHSAGSITSHGYMKRWNRKNELLADAAERASVAAEWLGAARYPRDKLTAAWTRFLAQQMHDILPGTSIPKVYYWSWNDEVVAMNQFAAVLENGVGAVCRAMDTQVEGRALVVFNPLSINREDVVEVTLRYPGGAPGAVRVFGPDGKETPSQAVRREDDVLQLIFLAKLPSVGFAVFDARPAESSCALTTGLKVTESSLENRRYRAQLDANGDIASITDKAAGREVLSAPIRLVLMRDKPAKWPAWNMDWKDLSREPYACVSGPAQVRIVESGPVRVTVQVTREAHGSRFVQKISLAAGGAGNRLEFETDVEWVTYETCLKAVFPLSVSNQNATYDLGLGTVERPTAHPEQYEAPSQQWIDLSASDGSYGAAILDDCKYGSNKPDEKTIRLTLVRNPRDEDPQDIGRHHMLFALTAHTGDWRRGGVPWEAARLNQPPVVFESPAHPGKLGKRFSLLKVSSAQVSVKALKKAEDTDEAVVRLQELHGRAAQGVTLSPAAPIVAARELNGMEEEIGEADLVDGKLVCDFEPYRPRTFALKLGNPPARLSAPVCAHVALEYDLDAISSDANRSDGDMDGHGRALPAELVPDVVESEGIAFKTGSTEDGRKNALVCRGQTVKLPPGDYNRLYLLASALEDTQGDFELGGKSVNLGVQSWSGVIGQWDSCMLGGELTDDPAKLQPAFIKRDTIGLLLTHRHWAPRGRKGWNEPYVFCYLFKYGLPLPKGATEIKLPDNPKIRVFAMTVARNDNDAAGPAQDLYDRFDPPAPRPSFDPNGGRYDDAVSVEMDGSLFTADYELRYTTDGRDPATQSPVYDGPFHLFSSKVLKGQYFREAKPAGPCVTSEFKIDDRSPPQVTEVGAVEEGRVVAIVFSEPLDEASARKVGNYAIDGGVKVTSAELDQDMKSVVLSTSGLKAETVYNLSINGVRDRSPAGNAISGNVKHRLEIDADLVLHLAFEDQEADSIVDSSPTGATGSVDGGARRGEGRFGGALIFDGDDDQVIFKDRPKFNPMEGITIAAWIKPDDLHRKRRRVLQKGKQLGRQYRLWIEGGLKFELYKLGLLKGPSPQPGEWTHVAGTYDGSVMRLFIDGREVAKCRVSGKLPVTGDPVYVGSNHASTWKGNRFKGVMDEVRVYSRGLHPAEVRVLAGKPGLPGGQTNNRKED